MQNLSKSKLLAYRQCPKRLWLEIHQPNLREDSDSTEASYKTGHSVGDIARQIYDPEGIGDLLDLKELGMTELLAKSDVLARTSSKPLFEAGFTANGALSLADVMLPTRQGRKRAWRVVEVKSATSLKDYHRDDAAIQAYVTRAAGIPLTGIALAHIDKTWVYPGKQDYRGLFVEHDLTEEAFARGEEVECWIAEAQAIVRKLKEPAIKIGEQCRKPYACSFYDHCSAQQAEAEHPVSWLPNIQSRALKDHIADGIIEMRDVPDKLLNERQRRVKHCTLNDETYFDAESAATELAAYKLPGYFLDFETINLAVPIWKGVCPYQQVPFQFSVHRLSRTGKLEHREFLDLSGKDPSKALAEALIEACGERGPVFVYYAAFETGRIKELAERFPRMKKALLAINERIVDLLPIAEKHYYHPSQQGSWSIKKLLPAIAPELSYDALDGVQDGGMAMGAFKVAITPSCTEEHVFEIKSQLLRYCYRDTIAMVNIFDHFSGNRHQIASLNLRRQKHATCDSTK